MIDKRTPTIVELLQGRRIETLLEQNLEIQQIPRSSKGFIITFGTWAPALNRKDDKSFWDYGRDLAQGREKLHPAQSWFKGYFWDKEDQAYLRLGSWAPQSFRNLVRIITYLRGLEMVVGEIPKKGPGNLLVEGSSRDPRARRGATTTQRSKNYIPSVP